MTFEVPESDVPAALPLMLMRGTLFQATLKEDATKPTLKPVKTWAAIATTGKAIALDGDSGMSIVLSFPQNAVNVLTAILEFREVPLILSIDEKTYRKVTP